MSDQHEVITEHETRIAELEQQLAILRRRPPVTKSRLSRRRLAAVGLVVALLAVPGVVLAGHRFSDVPNGHPFHDDIDWLADYGIANGFADGTYRPGQAVTRQAMAAFLHRLSNDFELVSTSMDPTDSTVHSGSATCPADKRVIAGGGSTTAANLFMTDSYPLGRGWYVRWETEDDVPNNPANLTVYALCAPRL